MTHFVCMLLLNVWRKSKQLYVCQVKINSKSTNNTCSSSDGCICIWGKSLSWSSAHGHYRNSSGQGDLKLCEQQMAVESHLSPAQGPAVDDKKMRQIYFIPWKETSGNKSWAGLDFSQKSQPLEIPLNDGVISPYNSQFLSADMNLGAFFFSYHLLRCKSHFTHNGKKKIENWKERCANTWQKAVKSLGYRGQ